MINRFLIRVKVIQILYAYFKNEDSTVKQAENNLQKSFEKAYELYFYILLLAVQIVAYAQSRIELRRNKFRPTDEDLNPNLKFIHNQFIAQLSENKVFKEFITKHKLSWREHQDVIKSLFENIAQSDFYKTYMDSDVADYEEDKDLWLKIFRKIILPNDELENVLEEQNIFWVDDLETVISFILKTIRHFDRSTNAEQPLHPMFGKKDDEEFGVKLLKTTIKNSEKNIQLIDAHTNNWELERVAFMDILIMQTALTEIETFPTIPVNVTMNEYIEIAKSYSTDRSATFINGVLDHVVKEMLENKQFIKVVKF